MIVNPFLAVIGLILTDRNFGHCPVSCNTAGSPAAPPPFSTVAAREEWLVRWDITQEPLDKSSEDIRSRLQYSSSVLLAMESGQSGSGYVHAHQ